MGARTQTLGNLFTTAVFPTKAGVWEFERTRLFWREVSRERKIASSTCIYVSLIAVIRLPTVPLNSSALKKSSAPGARSNFLVTRT